MWVISRGGADVRGEQKPDHAPRRRVTVTSVTQSNTVLPHHSNHPSERAPLSCDKSELRFLRAARRKNGSVASETLLAVTLSASTPRLSCDKWQSRLHGSRATSRRRLATDFFPDDDDDKDLEPAGNECRADCRGGRLTAKLAPTRRENEERIQVAIE